MSAQVVTQGNIRARRAGFLGDMVAVAERGLRSIVRDPETVVPSVVIPAFFFAVNVGALQDLAEGVPGVDYKAFQIPAVLLFGITGVSRAMILVTDIQTGYFDRLSITPLNRFAMLLGFMVSDFVLFMALTVPVLVLGFAVGVRFETGLLGVVVFFLVAGAWGLAFAGFPYAIALKTGNPIIVGQTFLLFLPFVFLTTVFLPREVMTGWLATVTDYNPVTYLLGALRSLISPEWEVETLLKGIASTAGVGAVSMTLALAALRGRVRKR